MKSFNQLLFIVIMGLALSMPTVSSAQNKSTKSSTKSLSIGDKKLVISLEEKNKDSEECSDECVEERIKDFESHRWVVEASTTLSTAFFLNNIYVGDNALHTKYKAIAPEISVMFGFRNHDGGRFNGFELGWTYASVPSIPTTTNLIRMGWAHSRIREIGSGFLYRSSNNLGYILGICHANNSKNEYLKYSSNGIYWNLSKGIYYKVSKGNALGLSATLAFHYMWDWKSGSERPEIGLKRPGFGIYPTISLSYIFGGGWGK